MIISTHNPSFTRWLHAERPDLLQVVDEPVEPAERLFLATAERLGLELRRYETYDIHSREPGVPARGAGTQRGRDMRRPGPTAARCARHLRLGHQSRRPAAEAAAAPAPRVARGPGDPETPPHSWPGGAEPLAARAGHGDGPRP